jgi:hypothetical protein
MKSIKPQRYHQMLPGMRLINKKQYLNTQVKIVCMLHRFPNGLVMAASPRCKLWNVLWYSHAIRVCNTPYGCHEQAVCRLVGKIKMAATSSGWCTYWGSSLVTKQTHKLHGLSPRANYTDRATAACRRSDCQLLRIKVPRGQLDGSLRPYSRFYRQEPLLFYQVAPQLYSRGWVDPVPDPLFFFW